MEDIFNSYVRSTKIVQDALLNYIETLNIPIGTNALNARNHVKSDKEKQNKEDNEEKVE